MADIVGFLKKLPFVAATIASGMPGPIGVIAGAVSTIIGGKVDPNPASITKAIAGATPEQMIALQKLEMDHAETMKAAGYKTATELLQQDVDDRKDARGMQVGVRSWVPAALALVVTLGFFGMIVMLLLRDAPPGNTKTLDLLTGGVTTAWVMVIAFYFGSSAGSQAKDKLLLEAQPPK